MNDNIIICTKHTSFLLSKTTSLDGVFPERQLSTPVLHPKVASLSCGSIVHRKGTVNPRRRDKAF